jgi:hypothetical protein
MLRNDKGKGGRHDTRNDPSYSFGAFAYRSLAKLGLQPQLGQRTSRHTRYYSHSRPDPRPFGEDLSVPREPVGFAAK